MRLKVLSLTAGLLCSMASATDLSGVKTYLAGKINTQLEGTQMLKKAANEYYSAAKAANFEYGQLVKDKKALAALKNARLGWEKASPAYEDIEGIVAGVEQLAEFDLILDAGTSAEDGGEDVVPFSLKLPNGKMLEKPGNLFGVNEGTLWGTVGVWSSGVKADVNGNGKMDFGDQLPDANILKSAAQGLHDETVRMQKAANAWKPSQEDVFGALVGNVPTVGPVFFEDWKSSPFVLGEKSNRKDFVVISRLSDLSGNVRSWQAMYKGLSGDVKAKNATLDAQINEGLTELEAFVGKLVDREQTRRYSPEQAEQLQKEAQNRATVITGRITQAASLLGVKAD